MTTRTSSLGRPAQDPGWNWPRGLASPLCRDGLLAATLCLLDLASQWEPDASDRLIGSGPVPAWVTIGYAVVGYSVLTWRRREPTLVFAALWAHALLALILLPGYRPLLGLLFALYVVATQATLVHSLAALAGALLTFALAMVHETQGLPAKQATGAWLAGLVLFGGLGGATWAVGRWIGHSRRQVESLEVRRLQEAREAVAVERARIARELHDIVAHSVTIMVLQAAGAQRVLAADRDRARGALKNIEETGTQAMDELRRLLGLLRQATPEPGEEPEPNGPGLDAIPVLLQRIRAAGIAIQESTRGRPGRLDASVDHTAYRVVQEALTNVSKHAGPGTHATLCLDWQPETLSITIVDDAAGRPDVPSETLSNGKGLIGLAERVAIVGGHLQSVPQERSGFRVHAELPSSTVSPRDTSPAALSSDRTRGGDRS